MDSTPDAAQPDLTMRQVLALYLLLEAPRRVGELARMLGDTEGDAARRHAQALLRKEGKARR